MIENETAKRDRNYPDYLYAPYDGPFNHRTVPFIPAGEPVPPDTPGHVIYDAESGRWLLHHVYDMGGPSPFELHTGAELPNDEHYYYGPDADLDEVLVTAYSVVRSFDRIDYAWHDHKVNGPAEGCTCEDPIAEFTDEQLVALDEAEANRLADEVCPACTAKRERQAAAGAEWIIHRDRALDPTPTPYCDCEYAPVGSTGTTEPRLTEPPY